MKYTIGIDIGKKGGICILDSESKKIEYLTPMPLLEDGDIDGNKIIEILQNKILENCHCFIEKLHSMPIFSSKGNFSFGGQYSTIKTLLRIIKIPFTEISAKTWQKDIFRDMKVFKKANKKNDTKKMALIRVKDLFPGEDFTSTERSKKEHDGMIDATLIAYYGSSKN